MTVHSSGWFGWFSARHPPGRLGACAFLAPRRNDAADFRSLVDGATEGIYVRRGLTFLYANQACASMFGFDSPKIS